MKYSSCTYVKYGKNVIPGIQRCHHLMICQGEGQKKHQGLRKSTHCLQINFQWALIKKRKYRLKKFSFVFSRFPLYNIAMRSLNSTQPQLKLRLRLALFLPGQATQPPTTQDCRFYTSLLHDYSRLIQGCLKTTKRLI